MKSIWMIALVVASLSRAARADTIRFPEDELAPESVLPVFDQPTSTKLRAIMQTHRFEVGLGGSYNMTEPFFSPLGFGGTLGYHWNEESMASLNFGFFSGKARTYDQQINVETQFNANIYNAPPPKYLVMGTYQYTPFYGKLSVTKNYVMHMHLFGDAGLGGFKIGDKMYPALSLGLGPQFDFTRDLAVKLDLKMLLHQGPNVLATPLRTTNSTNEVSSSAYPSKIFYDTLLAFNLVYLIP